jgi:hypothetical protein
VAAARTRLDSLMPLYERAQRRAVEAEESRREVERRRTLEGTDTLLVGQLTVVVLEGKDTEARAHFQAAWDLYGPMLDGAPARTLDGHLFGFQHELEFRPMPLPAGSTEILERGWRREPVVRGAVRHAVGRRLTDALPAAQRSWIASTAIGFSPPFGRVYRELVLTRSRVTERCRVGDLAACWAAVGALPSDDPVGDVRAWYTEADRGTRAEAYPTRSEEWTRCVGGDTGACDAFLSADRERAIPLSTTVRTSLVMFALERGGRGALVRLAEPIGGPSEGRGGESPGRSHDFRALLGRTARMDPDRLMAEWHSRVMAARPENAGPDEETRLLTLLWIFLFAGLSARSTRWRSV